MKISKQARRDAKSLYGTCRVDGLLDERRVRTAVQEVIAKKPRGYVAVLHHFQRLVRLDIARRAVRVESAVPLGADMQQSVRNNLSSRYGQGLSVEFVQNPALIGGLKVQVGSDVFDGSVASRLASLQDRF